MDEYIEREAVLDIIKRTAGDYATAWSEIVKLPANDVAPVVHGRWIARQNPQWPAYRHDACSICGWWNTKNSMCYEGTKKPGHSLNYCPSCGAKMDEGYGQGDKLNG